MTEDATRKCSVRDGAFVEPCATLNSMVDNFAPAFSKAKGVSCWTYTSMTTLKPARRFYGLKSKDHPNGMLFNFCPWCGEDISSPFTSKEEDEAA